MVPFADWFPLALVGSSFTALGALKLYGMWHNVIGGGGKPFATRLLGSCPTWSQHVNVAVTLLFLAIGLTSLATLAWDILTAGRP